LTNIFDVFIVEPAIVRWQRKVTLGLSTSKEEPVKRLFFVCFRGSIYLYLIQIRLLTYALGMEDVVTIAVLAGTTREQRQSIKAARYIAEFGKSLPNVEIIFVDPKEFNFPGDGNDPEGKDPKYSDITAKADAFFVVTPEYNHSFPGSLKRMLDSELGNYNHKPVAFAGCSNGNWGGVRAVESLVPAIRETGLVVMSWDVYFPYVQNIFEESGQIKEEYRERYSKSLAKLYTELIWFGRMLKTARQELIKKVNAPS
jgi:NAD(P)H-dependent FMN reductase